MSEVFIIAGELSGDTHGAGLIRALRDLRPQSRFRGLGGPQMREVGGAEIDDWVQTAGVVGLWEVLKMYGWFKQRFEQTVSDILATLPAAVILVDYPGFNLRAAKALRQRGYRGKIIYYISPQVWAWKKGRVKLMARLLDLVICIFPFEKAFYEASGLRAEFGGHPMVDRAAALRAPSSHSKRPLQRETGLIGFFPGSRRHEVRRLFPLMLQAAQLIRHELPQARFAISAANAALAGEMRLLALSAGMAEAAEWIETGTAHALMQRATAGAVASGTATLEAACLGLPYALVYRVNWLTYLAGKAVVRIPRIGIINILAGREVVRELVQHVLTPENLAQELLRLARDGNARAALQADLARIVATLGEPGAYQRAARIVSDEMDRP